ncbi:MAG: ABC transporter ATP-binding protein [Clostridia bacterium]|nr:ABC transporter ATP-binding protein [Clostridia bacterium]
MNAIEIKNLTKSYGKSRGIIDVSFDIPEGEVFGFIGPNGAGKSTTIRTLLAFIYPNSGSAKILGKDCIAESAGIKKDIGYLPSEVNYYDDMKVKELLDYSAKFYRKDCSRRICELSEIFEVDLNKRIDALSFGNKKKVGILQALIHEPRVLILDEPTGGLDPLMQNNFFDVLREENKKGTTIFFSSHILSEVQKMCDRVAIIKEGKILKVEHIDKLRSNKYKRIKVEFKEVEAVSKIQIDGIMNKSIKERSMEFLYGGRIEELLKRLSEFQLENLWIEEPSLEEIFMHYYEKGGN